MQVKPARVSVLYAGLENVRFEQFLHPVISQHMTASLMRVRWQLQNSCSCAFCKAASCNHSWGWSVDGQSFRLRAALSQLHAYLPHSDMIGWFALKSGRRTHGGIKELALRSAFPSLICYAETSEAIQDLRPNAMTASSRRVSAMIETEALSSHDATDICV